MIYPKIFSVIIPCWRGAAHFLPILFNSIPNKEGIEIIVVDNSSTPLSREEIDTDRDIILIHSAPERHAGGSRNDGISAAKGKWLLFADADDYFTPNAFDVFYEYVDSECEIVFTGMGGVYADTGEKSDRGDIYAMLVHRYCEGEIDEIELRLGFASPCCKMVSHSLVDRYHIQYDEIRAGNDMFFSLVSGYYAKSIAAVDMISYIATVNRGSLTQLRDPEVIKARLFSKLHCNQFLKQHGLAKRQQSIMYALYEARKFGFKAFLDMIILIIRFRQNPFIGWKHWFATLKSNRRKDKLESKYIVK